MIYIHSYEIEPPRKPEEYIKMFTEKGVNKTIEEERQYWIDIGYATEEPQKDYPEFLMRSDFLDLIFQYLLETDHVLYLSLYGDATLLDGVETLLERTPSGKISDYDLRQHGLIRVEHWYQDSEGHYTWVVHAPVGTVRAPAKPLIKRS